MFYINAKQFIQVYLFKILVYLRWKWSWYVNQKYLNLDYTQKSLIMFYIPQIFKTCKLIEGIA